MTNKAYRNYVALSQGKEHKKLYKAKKRWVVAGISFLALMGLGATANGNNSTLASASSRKSVTRVHHHKARHQRRVTLHSKKEIKAMRVAKAKKAKRARIKRAKARKAKAQLRKMSKLGMRKHSQKRNKNLRHGNKAKKSHKTASHAVKLNAASYERKVRLPSASHHHNKKQPHQSTTSVAPALQQSLIKYENEDSHGATPYAWHKKHQPGFDGSWDKEVNFVYNGTIIGKGIARFGGDNTKEKGFVSVPSGYQTTDGKTRVQVKNTGYNNHVLDADTNGDGSVTRNGTNYKHPWNIKDIQVQPVKSSSNKTPQKPQQTSDAFNTIDYNQGGNIVGTEVIEGTPGESASDAINSGLPSGYTIDSSFDVNDAKVGKDGSTINVPLDQNKSQETLTFTNNGTPVGTHTASGTGTGTVGDNPAGLPNGYKVNNPGQTYKFDNGNTNVPVSSTTTPKKTQSPKKQAPVNKTDNFKYMYGKKPEGHTDYTGNPATEKITLGANPRGINKGFVVPKAAANTVYKLDGKTRVIQVQPSRYNIKDVNVLHNNQVGYYHGVKVQRLDMNKGQYRHFRWYKMNQRGAWIHTDILSVGHRKNYIFFMKPHKGIYHRITRIFRLNFGKHDKQIRYEFKIGNMNYFVTGNPEFTVNSYWQQSEFNGHHAIRVIRPCAEYTSRYYNHNTHVKNFKVGSTVHVKGIMNIGRKGDYQTRFIMDNGHYITANKNFVQLV